MSEWQPIESAPKDGTFVLLYDDSYAHSPSSYLLARYDSGIWWGQKLPSGKVAIWREATHWMPLPEPPAALKVNDWTTVKPAAAGIYRIRGWHIGRKRDIAVVVVARYSGRFVCNLHESTSNPDTSDWSRISDMSARFEWQLVEAEA